MTTSYWTQFDQSDLDSWQGKECHDDVDSDLEHKEVDTDLNQECPKCGGCGCNYCLMTSY